MSLLIGYGIAISLRIGGGRRRHDRMVSVRRARAIQLIGRSTKEVSGLVQLMLLNSRLLRLSSSDN